MAEFDYSDPVQSFVAAVRGVVLQPVGFYRAMRKRGDLLNPLVFALVCATISAILGGIIGFLIGLAGGQQGVGEAFVGLISGIIFAPIFAAIGLFIGAGIAHLLVMLIVGSGNAGFEATFRVVSYAQVTQLVGWIPLIGGLIAGIWGIVLSILGIREAHATTTGKAALVVLIPAAIVLLLVLILGALIGAAIFFGTQR
ncbi:MAG: YIP1 family protein [Actinomycetota bacterium]